MNMYNKSTVQILQELELLRIRATTSCDAQAILPEADYPYVFRVSTFQYGIREVRELLSYIEKQLVYMETDVKETYEYAHKIKLQFLSGGVNDCN